VLENLPPEPAPPPVAQRARRRLRSEPAAPPEETALVGANLHPSYARNLALLHAETGKTKKELLQEALDLLFSAKGIQRKQ
jgi:hypothetical protein